MRFAGFRRNWPEFAHYMREYRHWNANHLLIRKTRSYRFPGHVDVYGKDGKREPLQAAVDRFKRLDFGAYINVPIGKNHKAYRKTAFVKARCEQHVFTFPFFNRKLDRMFTSELKEKRYFIDDPYEKYNKMSFLKYQDLLMKNEMLIEKYGGKQYKFDRYRTHMDRLSIFNRRPLERYVPPGFFKTVADTGGVYKPEGENVYHDPDWMAPHCQRTRIREPDFILSQKNFHKTRYYLDRRIKFLRMAEVFHGKLKPWARIMHKTRY